MKVTDVGFIIPTRNNLEYVKLAYSSIRALYPDNMIVVLNDASTDEVEEWIFDIHDIETYETFASYEHLGPDRAGHTVLYDIGFQILQRTGIDYGMIFHADMVAMPGMLENLIKWWKPGRVVCATRIEPPLHPPGPEKIIKEWGDWPHEFKNDEATEFVNQKLVEYKNQTSVGIFAPWLISYEDMKRVGGHDALFAPMELEDSDIFNRWHNAGYDFIQSWDSFVYHFTSRGSRWKDGKLGENSEEYTKLREIKLKEWERRWRQPVAHTPTMRPIVRPVYDKVVGLNVPDQFKHWFDDIPEAQANVIFRFPEKWDDNIHVPLLHMQCHVISTTPESTDLQLNGVSIQIKKKVIREMILPEIKNVL